MPIIHRPPRVNIRVPFRVPFRAPGCHTYTGVFEVLTRAIRRRSLRSTRIYRKILRKFQTHGRKSPNALIDAGDVPAVADIETRLEGTKNAVFAKYAFGVQR